MRRGVELAIVQQSENKPDSLARCEDESAFMVVHFGLFELA